MTEVCTPDERKALEIQLRGIHPDGTPGDLPETISVPAAVEPGWTFLGYDVADLGGLSGLMNCGFVPEVEDVDALRAHWGPKLNDWHLFDDLAGTVRRGSVPKADSTVADENPLWQEFARAMVTMIMPSSQAIADILGVAGAGPMRVLDIAAGHGDERRQNDRGERTFRDHAILGIRFAVARGAGR